MKKNNVKVVSMNAMIACLYAVATLAISPIAYGGIQMRISEILIFLVFYNRKFIPGLVIGCFIANMASPMGIWDMTFGTIATFIAVVLISKQKSLFISALIGAIVNGIIVGLELHLSLGLPLFINVLYVFIGEYLVLLLGIPVYKYMEKNKTFFVKYVIDNK